MQERGYLVFCENNSGNTTTFVYVRSTRFRLTEAADRVMIRPAID